jgi:hypothetical protein
MRTWPKQTDCAHLFGNPSFSGWGAVHLVPITPPFPMHMGAIPIHSIQINRIAADALAHVLATYWDKVGKDLARVKAEGVDIFSGSWNVRNMRGINQVSMHAYGLAIDLNAPQNPLGVAPGKTKGSFTSKSLIVQCFAEVGVVWGGPWRRPDAMHFQMTQPV